MQNSLSVRLRTFVCQISWIAMLGELAVAAYCLAVDWETIGGGLLIGAMFAVPPVAVAIALVRIFKLSKHAAVGCVIGIPMAVVAGTCVWKQSIPSNTDGAELWVEFFLRCALAGMAVMVPVSIWVVMKRDPSG